MPALKKKTKMKKMAKPAARPMSSRAMASSRRPSGSSKKEHPLFKPYLAKEQEQFHKDNPSAQMLIAIFLISVVVFYVVLYMTGNLF